ncbi:MAG: helix-turn-helix domain-containing protein [Aeromonas sp.]
MSMALMVKAMSIKVGNPLRKLVLIKLADNASDTGECWPSYQHIAEQCEISRRSVIVHIDALIASGLMSKEARVGALGKRSNVYFLSLDGGESLPKKSTKSPKGGAGDSLGVVQEIHHPSAGAALGGSAGAAHRISHSFEPVIESIKPPVSPKGDKHRRGARLPDDWVLPKSWGDWAMTEIGLRRDQVILEAASFADYWQSLPGAKAAKLDWEKTWRIWIRRSCVGAVKQPVNRKPEPPMPRAFGEERPIDKNSINIPVSASNTRSPKIFGE